MTPAEAQVLLSMAAAFDNRRPDADAARAWSAALDGLRFEDCRDALIEHYKTSADYLMPVLIRQQVKRIRAKRVTEAGDLTPPPGTVAEQCRWLGQARRRIGDGEPREEVEAAYELKVRVLPDIRALLPSPDDQHTEEA